MTEPRSSNFKSQVSSEFSRKGANYGEMGEGGGSHRGPTLALLLTYLDFFKSLNFFESWLPLLHRDILMINISILELFGRKALCVFHYVNDFLSPPQVSIDANIFPPILVWISGFSLKLKITLCVHVLAHFQQGWHSNNILFCNLQNAWKVAQQHFNI